MPYIHCYVALIIMSVIASCGHELSEQEGMGVTIAVKSYCKDGSKAIGYRLCKHIKTYTFNTSCFNESLLEFS